MKSNIDHQSHLKIIASFEPEVLDGNKLFNSGVVPLTSACRRNKRMS